MQVDVASGVSRLSTCSTGFRKRGGGGSGSSLTVAPDSSLLDGVVR